MKRVVMLRILGVILAVATIALGINEATKDIFDQIGSNYWLAYSSIICGAALIAVIVASNKPSAK